MKTALAALARYIVGALFTMTPLTAILVVGWTQRLAARSVARRWQKANAGEVEALARSEDAASAAWPRWFMADNAAELFIEARSSGLLRAAALRFRAMFGSLWLNAVLGIRALVPILVAAFPAGLLFLFSWWAGWDNSFNKGYEQSGIGQLIAFTGMAYFLVVMTLLPLAEVRQAVSNSWRSFFDIPHLRRVAREARLGLIGLALAFVAAGFIVAAMKVAPLALGNTVDTPVEAERIARAYALLVAAGLFPLYVALRLAAARVYARATAKLAAKAATASRGNLGKLAVGSASLLAGAVASAVMFAVWFGLVAEIYVSQFLVHDWMHWINHPLIQLPWSGSIFWPS